MDAQDLALVQGLDHTRTTLTRWNRQPLPVLLRWGAASLLVTALLLVAVWLVAEASTPDLSGRIVPGLTEPAHFPDVLRILRNNGLVLALHAFACVAGFIAGSSLPLQAARQRGIWRRVHDFAGPLAIAFVSAATLFSLTTQAYILGNSLSTVAWELEASPLRALVGMLPHAVPELAALFLPLAAWLLASRRGDWHELLAATFVTTAIAVPTLILAAFVEVYVSPHLLAALTGHYTY
jgi:stage II sporulation SpoM-like protein